MKILVTGSAGYVGSTLARLLIQKNFDTTLIDNYLIPSNITDVEGIKINKVDIREDIDCSGYDVIFHLAALPGIARCEGNPNMSHDINVRGVFNLLRTVKPRCRFIFASTSAVYGICQHPAITEMHPTIPRSKYGEQKLEAERIVSYHNDYVILRFSNIYGRGLFTKRTVTDCFIDRALQGKPIEVHGKGTQRRDFVHLNDVLHAYWNAMKHKVLSTIYNIGGNEALNVNEIAELVVKHYRKVTGITLPIKHIQAKSGIEWKDFDYSSKKAKDFLNYEPSYSVGDEIRERFLLCVKAKDKI